MTIQSFALAFMPMAQTLLHLATVEYHRIRGIEHEHVQGHEIYLPTLYIEMSSHLRLPTSSDDFNFHQVSPLVGMLPDASMKGRGGWPSTPLNASGLLPCRKLRHGTLL